MRTSVGAQTRQVRQVSLSTLLHTAMLTMVVVLLLVLGVWHLDRYPATWFDEGMHAQVPKNLVQNGTYAVRSADGTRDYAPSIGVGPTVMLPIAGVFKLAGISLMSARLVPVVYLIVATLGIFLIAKSLFDRTVAFATIVLLITLPSLDWLATGRQVLGEIPALTFLVIGGILGVRAKTPLGVVAAGVVLGLAMVTKGQYALILPASLGLLAVLDRFDVRRRSLVWHATIMSSVIGTYVIWIVVLLLLIGDGHIVENVRLLRESSGGALLVFDPARAFAAWKVLLGPSSFMLVIPALFSGIWAIRSATGDRRFALIALWSFQVAWLGWFALGSIGWPRYAFAGLALNTVFMAHLIGRLISLIQFHRASAGGWSWAATSSTVVLAGVAVLAVIGGWKAVAPIVNDDMREPEAFAAVVEQEAPQDAVIDGWEPEVAFLTDRSFQYPPAGSLDRAVRARWLDDGDAPDLTHALQGDYLVVGPFGRWVGIYGDPSLSSRYVRVAAVGSYELFERKASANMPGGTGR